MARREITLGRLEQRVKELTEGFTSYVEAFNSKRLFTGPSLYFHQQTIARRHAYASAVQAIADNAFMESLYATLTAWGMHRMGPGETKLVDFVDFKDTIAAQTERIRRLEVKKLCAVRAEQIQELTQALWEIIVNLEIGISETKLVVGSKALHHILPDLIPPVDRQYTLKFFYGNKTLKHNGEVEFREMFPHFHRLAVDRKVEMKQLLANGIDSDVVYGMNTSLTKIIDNAIIGYVIKRLNAAS